MSNHRSFKDALEPYGTPSQPSEFPTLSIAAGLWGAGKLALALCANRTRPREEAKSISLDPDNLPAEVTFGNGKSARVLIFQETKLNAVAFSADNVYAASVYHGFLLALPELAVAIWGNANIAPWIGDVSRMPPLPTQSEESIPLGMEMAYWVIDGRIHADDTYEPMMSLRHRSLRMASTLCPVRRAALAYTINSAFKFLWRHEMGHVVFGHLEFLDEELGASSYAEVGGARLVDIDPLLSHLLELQADDFALSWTIGGDASRLQHAAQLRCDNTPIPAGQAQTPLTPRQVCAASLLGCLLITMLFQAADERRGRDGEMTTHPPLWARYAMALQIAKAEWDFLGNNNTLFSDVENMIDGIAHSHPMLGHWIGSLRDPRYQEILQRYFQRIAETRQRFGSQIAQHTLIHPSWQL